MLGWPRGPVVEAEAFSEDCTKLNSYSSALRDLVNLWRAVGGCWWRRGPDAPAREMVNQLPPPSLVGTCGWGGNGESLDAAPSSGIHVSAHGENLFSARPSILLKEEIKFPPICAAGQLQNERGQQADESLVWTGSHSARPGNRGRNSPVFPKNINVWEIFLPKVSCPKLN